MSTSPDDSGAAFTTATEPETDRRIVLVAGSGRSGTSTLSGALQQLGMYVPPPEVAADDTNPKGFAESQWVVDFHNELLGRVTVHPSDARPQAWFETGRLSLREPIRDRLHRWLDTQFDAADELVIKDPRLTWFLGLWRTAAIRSSVTPSFATMLRPPTEVISSKQRYYGGRLGDANRTAAWTNVMLHTERATRGSDRVFVRYHDLLSDWTSAIFRIGEEFDLRAVKTADSPNMQRVHGFIDPSLHRVQLSWDDIEVPPRLRDLADETWQQLNKLAEPGGDHPDVTHTLDELRAAYTDYYAEAEAIARSSINAERRKQAVRAERAIAEADKAARTTRATTEKVGHPRASQQASRAPGAHQPNQPAPSKTRIDRVAGRLPHGVRAMVPGRLRRALKRRLGGPASRSR